MILKVRQISQEALQQALQQALKDPNPQSLLSHKLLKQQILGVKQILELLLLLMEVNSPCHSRSDNIQLLTLLELDQ